MIVARLYLSRRNPLMNDFVITSPAGPGVVIQLDGHGAERLAMTVSAFIAANSPFSSSLHRPVC
jgi:hypothetical protein